MLNRPKPERVVNEDQGVDTAWKIHAAIVDWTGKVDTKASFALALESAAIAAIVSLTASGRKLSGLSGWPRATLWIGIGCLLLLLWQQPAWLPQGFSRERRRANGEITLSTLAT